MTVAAKVPGVWHRTTARPGSRACDGCKRRPRAGAGIAYRTHAEPGRGADLLCESCARSEPSHDADGRETERSIWDVARPSSTPEGRGQACLSEEVAEEARLLAYGWRRGGSRWFPPGDSRQRRGGGYTVERALQLCLRTGVLTSECEHAETCANCDPVRRKAEDRVDLTPELEAAEARHRAAIERVGRAYEEVARATGEAETAAAELHTSARSLDRIRAAMRDAA